MANPYSCPSTNISQKERDSWCINQHGPNWICERGSESEKGNCIEVKQQGEVKRNSSGETKANKGGSRKRRTRRKRGRGKSIDWSQVDYDSFADKELGNEFGGVFNRGSGQLETHVPTSKPQPKPKAKKRPTIKRGKNSRKLIGGKRRRRKSKNKRRSKRRRKRRNRSRRRSNRRRTRRR